VRNVAAEFRLNPLTVLKGYQQLVDEQLVEKRRGRGMYVNSGARQALMKDERQRFLEDEWPRTHATIARLGLTVEELMAVAPAPSPSPMTPPASSRGEAHDRAADEQTGAADDDASH
jgi:GntR family transcriptional regulator